MNLDPIEKANIGSILSISTADIQYPPQIYAYRGLTEENMEIIRNHIPHCRVCQEILNKDRKEFQETIVYTESLMKKFERSEVCQSPALQEAYDQIVFKEIEADLENDAWKKLSNKHKKQFKKSVYSSLKNHEKELKILSEHIDIKTSMLIEDGYGKELAKEMATNSINAEFRDFMRERGLNNSCSGPLENLEMLILQIIGSAPLKSYPVSNFELLKGSGLYSNFSDQMKEIMERKMEEHIEFQMKKDEFEEESGKKEREQKRLNLLQKLLDHINNSN